MSLFSSEALFRINLIWGIFDIALGLIGLYFVYRYVIAVLIINSDDRAILLGPLLSKWVPTSDTFFIFVGALYLAFKCVTLLVTSARWEMSLERESVNIKNVKKKRKKENKFFKVSDFTETT
jgi:hypothetical protein